MVSILVLVDLAFELDGLIPYSSKYSVSILVLVDLAFESIFTGDKTAKLRLFQSLF